jgi:hypothetical protein
MTHVRTSPFYPQSNGKIERWHKTLKGECIRPGTPLSLDDARPEVGGGAEATADSSKASCLTLNSATWRVPLLAMGPVQSYYSASVRRLNFLFADNPVGGPSSSMLVPWLDGDSAPMLGSNIGNRL